MAVGKRKRKRKRGQIYFLVILVSCLIGGCGHSEVDEYKKGEVRFLIEPQCEIHVRNYLDDLKKTEGFRTDVFEINTKNSIFSNIRNIGVISSSLLDAEDLQAYILGSMRSCGAKREFEFEIHNSDSMQSFVSLITQSAYSKDRQPFYMRLQGDKLIVNTQQ